MSLFKIISAHETSQSVGGAKREKPHGTHASRTWLVARVPSVGLEPTPDNSGEMKSALLTTLRWSWTSKLIATVLGSVSISRKNKVGACLFYRAFFKRGPTGPGQ